MKLEAGQLWYGHSTYANYIDKVEDGIVHRTLLNFYDYPYCHESANSVEQVEKWIVAENWILIPDGVEPESERRPRKNHLFLRS